MSRQASSVGLALALLVSGCDEVTVSEPVGEVNAELDAEDWTGTWSDPDGNVLFIQDVDAKAGRLRLTWLEEDSDGTLQRQQMDAIVRESNEWRFVSVAFAGEGTSPPTSYWWGRVASDGDTVLVWVPDASKFGELVGRGLLPGKVESEDTVHLGKLEPNHLKLVTSEEQGVLFHWAEPLIARRVSR